MILTDYYCWIKSNYNCDNLKINGPKWTTDRESSKWKIKGSFWPFDRERCGMDGFHPCHIFICGAGRGGPHQNQRFILSLWSSKAWCRHFIKVVVVVATTTIKCSFWALENQWAKFTHWNSWYGHVVPIPQFNCLVIDKFIILWYNHYNTTFRNIQ